MQDGVLGILPERMQKNDLQHRNICYVSKAMLVLLTPSWNSERGYVRTLPPCRRTWQFMPHVAARGFGKYLLVVSSESRCQHHFLYLFIYIYIEVRFDCILQCFCFVLSANRLGVDDYPHTQTKQYLQNLLNTSLANALVGNGMLEGACERCSSCAACWPCGRTIDEPRWAS